MKNPPKPLRRTVTTKRYASVLAMTIAVGCLYWPEDTLARQNSVNGALSLGNDYDSNVFKSNTFREGEWKSHITPQLSFTSKGLTDSLALTYTPEFTYNYRREDDEMTHLLSLAADKEMSSRWKVTMTGDYGTFDNLFFEANANLSQVQNFLRADAATQAEIVHLLFPEQPWSPTTSASLMPYIISQFQQRYDADPGDQGLIRALLLQGVNGARQRYSTSSMTVNSAYEFAEKSTITLGYNFTDQDYKTGRLSDHIMHTPSLLVAYQVNPQWRTEIGYDVSFNTYDNSNSFETVGDSTNNHPHLQVDFQVSPQNLLFWNYDYQQISFDEATRGDTKDQGSHVGWQHGFDQRTTLTTTIGTSYLDQEMSADEREYNLGLGLNRTFDRGSISFSGLGTTSVADTDGSWDKSRRSWQLGSDVSYKLKQDLSSIGHVSYERRYSWLDSLKNTYDTLSVGAGLSYGFSRWYTLSLDYNYYLFDTNDINLDDYTEHLVSIKLAAAKELWHW